jgi:outer membrane immunogenic protein
MYRKLISTVAIVLLFAGASIAQELKSEVSVEGTGFFTKNSDNHGIHQEATKTGGVLAGYRYHFSRWLAAEADYGYARNTQKYTVAGTLFPVQANVHEITGALVVTAPTLREKYHLFALGGGGGLVFDPTRNFGASVPGTSRDTKGAFLYGGGLDYDLTRRLALRAEYRGLVYKVPDFGLSALHTDTFTHVAQPSAGLVFKF